MEVKEEGGPRGGLVFRHTRYDGDVDLSIAVGEGGRGGEGGGEREGGREGEGGRGREGGRERGRKREREVTSTHIK